MKTRKKEIKKILNLLETEKCLSNDYKFHLYNLKLLLTIPSRLLKDNQEEILIKRIKEYGKNETYSKKVIREIFLILKYREKYDDSWIFYYQMNSIYHFSFFRILDYIINEENEDLIKDNLVESMLSFDSLIPYDFKAAICNYFINICTEEKYKGRYCKKVINFLYRFRAFGVKQSYKTMEFCGNEVDHYYKCNYPARKLRNILMAAVNYKEKENAFRILYKAINYFDIGYDEDKVSNGINNLERINDNSYNSEQAIAFLEQILENEYLQWNDYIVNWNQVVVRKKKLELTLAEIAKLALLNKQFVLPDPDIQLLKCRVFRSLFKVSSGSIIGLGAGIFLAEHEMNPRPSIFCIGRNVILGKSLMIEAYGGIIVGNNAFLGGGFIPIVVHTHKHISISDNAVGERKRIVPSLFVVRSGKRLSMEKSELIEVADFFEVEYADGVFALRV